MQKALLIISDLENSLIDAEHCDDSYFSQGFQCPKCKGRVVWRRSHPKNVNGSEQLVRATFVHSPDAPYDCPLRNDSFTDSGFSQLNHKLTSQEQSAKKFEDAVLKCLKYHQASKIDYYKHKDLPEVIDNRSLAIQVFVREAHLDRQIFSFYKGSESQRSHSIYLIQASSKVLNSDQAFQYLETKASKLKASLHQEEKLVVNVGTLIRIIGYLQNGCSDEFRQEFLRKAIFGSPKLSIPINRLWNIKEIQILQDWLNLEILCDDQLIEDQKVADIKKRILDLITAPSLKRIREDHKFLDAKLNDFVEYPKSNKSKFIRFVLITTWQSIKNCDWSFVPELYI